MYFRSKDGHLLIDTMMSLIVVSLVTTTLFRYHTTTSKITRCSYINHQRLHKVMQVMDSVLHAKMEADLPKDINISVRYVPITSDTIQEKPYNYSFDFETNFTFVVVTYDIKNSKQKKKPLIVVSGMHRAKQ